MILARARVPILLVAQPHPRQHRHHLPSYNWRVAFISIAPAPRMILSTTGKILRASGSATQPDRLRRRLDQYRAKIVDVGQRRARGDRIPSAPKNPCPSLLSSASFGSNPGPMRARGVRRHERSGNFFLAVDPSVSPAIAWMRACPSSAIASDNRYSTLRPPRPAPRTVTVVSPPDNKMQGRGKAGPCRQRARRCPRIPCQHPAPRPRWHREDMGSVARGATHLRCGLEAIWASR